MKPLKIGRMRISNFKAVMEFDHFFQRDLIVFDGPNGFGKTTLFDALELVMFGRIKRIDDYKIIDQKQGYRDSLYFNDPTKDVLIQVQFYNEETSFVVTKRLPGRKKMSSKAAVANSPTAWNQFETYMTDDFVDQFQSDQSISQEQVHKKMDVSHLVRAFHLFYYIQQEEKTHFIKSSEKERLKVLSDLFDTKKEEEERKKIDDTRKILKNKLDLLGNEIDKLKKEDTTELHNPTSQQSVLYSSLITLESKPLWDQDSPIVTVDLRNKSHDELDKLKDLVLHINAYESATFNKQLNSYIDNQNLIQSTVILLSHLKLNSTQLREKEKRQKEYRDWFNRLERNRLVDEINKSGITEGLHKMVTELHIPIQEDALYEIIKRIIKQRKNSSELSDIVVQINETRDVLLEKNKRFSTNLSEASDSECPMCGQDWMSVEALSGQLESKRKVFEQYYTDSALAVKELSDELFTNYITIIRDRLNEYITTPENIVDQSFFMQWEAHLKYQSQVQLFAEWCESQGYELTPFVNSQMSGINQQQLESLKSNLREFLRSKMLIVEANYEYTSDNYSDFDRMIRTFFANEIARVKELNIEQIEQKCNYIDQLYYRTNAEKKAQIQLKLQELYKKQERLLEYENQISTIIATYDNAIREHWAKIIKDIEVIFYLYFAKITQYYQRGLGMFIQQQRESDKTQGIAKALRFVCNIDSDQDAINYLSSGQLSALVIAFTLALNRVYNRGLGMLLIDDPVQTMDDINMASLTELLRNDFNGMQIIVSTHEDQASRYFKYKFLKYGLDADRISMKEKALQLS